MRFNSTNNAYVLAHVFSLAHPYGQPSVLSSYGFEQRDDGAPDNGSSHPCFVPSNVKSDMCMVPRLWTLLCDRRLWRMALSAPLVSYRRHGRLQEELWRYRSHELAGVHELHWKDRIWPWFVHSLLSLTWVSLAELDVQ